MNQPNPEIVGRLLMEMVRPWMIEQGLLDGFDVEPAQVVEVEHEHEYSSLAV